MEKLISYSVSVEINLLGLPNIVEPGSKGWTRSLALFAPRREFPLGSLFNKSLAERWMLYPNYCNYFPQKTHSLLTIIETFGKHSSVLKIKKRKLDSVFSFRKTSQEEVSKVIRDLNTKKSCQTSGTPTKIIKLNSDIFSNLIYKHFNYCIDKDEFPNLKHVNIVPVYKKNNKCEKENYRPVSILSNLSKIYEKLMYNQLYDYFDNILFPVNVASGKGIVLNTAF